MTALGSPAVLPRLGRSEWALLALLSVFWGGSFFCAKMAAKVACGCACSGAFSIWQQDSESHVRRRPLA